MIIAKPKAISLVVDFLALGCLLLISYAMIFYPLPLFPLFYKPKLIISLLPYKTIVSPNNVKDHLHFASGRYIIELERDSEKCIYLPFQLYLYIIAYVILLFNLLPYLDSFRQISYWYSSIPFFILSASSIS